VFEALGMCSILFLRAGVTVLRPSSHIITNRQPANASLSSMALSHPQRDETRGNYMAAAENSRMLRVGSNRTRRFRSLWKAFHKERYAKVEVMRSSLVDRLMGIFQPDLLNFPQSYERICLI